MNLIPFAGAIISCLLAISHWIESKEKSLDTKKNQFLKGHHHPTLVQSENRFLYRYAPSFLFFAYHLTISYLCGVHKSDSIVLSSLWDSYLLPSTHRTS